MREILAAWVCCGAVAFAAVSMTKHRDHATAAYAGVMLPDRLASKRPETSIEDEFADDADVADTSVAVNEAPAPPDPPQDVAAVARICRLRLLAHRLL
jgi:hypothetical protein